MKKTLRIFYDNLARHQSDFIVLYSGHPVGLSRMEKTIRMLELSSWNKVCDIGCGEGLVTDQIKRITPGVTGFDISEVRARSTAARNIDALCASATDIPLKDSQFDRVLCTEVMEHLPVPEEALREINRILKTGGKVVFSVPSEQVISNTILDIPDYELVHLTWSQIHEQYKVRDAHVQSFTETSFKELLIKNGFQVTGINYTYEHSLRPTMAIWYIFRLWRTFVPVIGEKRLYSPLGKRLLKLIFFLFYKRKSSKHHIIVSAYKLRSPG